MAQQRREERRDPREPERQPGETAEGGTPAEPEPLAEESTFVEGREQTDDEGFLLSEEEEAERDAEADAPDDDEEEPRKTA